MNKVLWFAIEIWNWFFFAANLCVAIEGGDFAAFAIARSGA